MQNTHKKLLFTIDSQGLIQKNNFGASCNLAEKPKTFSTRQIHQQNNCEGT